MDVSTGRDPRRKVALTCSCGRILHPGFFLENFDGLIGSIGVAVLKNGLKPETDIAFVVSPLRSEESSSVVNLAPKASEDIGNVAAGVFAVWHFCIHTQTETNFLHRVQRNIKIRFWQ